MQHVLFHTTYRPPAAAARDLSPALWACRPGHPRHFDQGVGPPGSVLVLRASVLPSGAACFGRSARNTHYVAKAFAKSFFSAKDLYEYTMNYLHQEKSLRDQEPLLSLVARFEQIAPWPGAWAVAVAVAVASALAAAPADDAG